MCYQIYPGATHKRFEHSLGVMEVAGRIFDQLFERRMPDKVEKRVADELQPDRKGYWRKVVRIAGLLHDLGHLPFSHRAEEALLPEGWDHEQLTAEMIRNSEIAGILRDDRPPIEPEDVVDVAWDTKERLRREPGLVLSPWKTLLNEIICGDTFGADRIDYMLRDSWHAGVVYGRFDPDRLISGLTAVIDPNNEEIAIGLDIGGIHTAEALLLARYFMYTQVYFHDVRRAYDLHLKEFLQAWLANNRFSTNWRDIMEVTDHEVLAAIRSAASDPGGVLHDLACRLLARRHFRTIYELVSTHKRKCPTILDDLIHAAETEFGKENIRSDRRGPRSEINDFLVQTAHGSIESSLQVSGVIANLPAVEIGLVFAEPSISEKAKIWIDSRLKEFLSRDS